MSKLEIIVENKRDAVLAEKYGADRLELVSAIASGGLTPSFGTIKQVLSSVTIPVRVMVRPQSYSFLLRKDELESALEDVRIIRSLGADGIVFGSITEDGEIDTSSLEAVLDEAGDMALTFHRAFDQLTDPLNGWRQLRHYRQVTSVLTSGGKTKAIEGLPLLKKLSDLQKYETGPAVLPGSGLNRDNLASVHQTLKTGFYHIGSAARRQGSFALPPDKEEIAYLRSLIQ
ncbi:copper homeostasis protein CutC [Salisediminibacterium halotolerans]|uniref:copper homeostasis protein CutC n=1 Tax=Salisediminibacterium halotolerans TaxID=517425 RepID=UPI000EABB92A|nr:copper homeostasis protein CutC [Salisediminibacterium halotolerans]RLJ73155.1 copper homeostasis protein [Actinophytocola xinjiangensis]RPE86577.1 copper homeostasis protein [Salisediminibacterium halotolerans]TWG33952.1 copper homeostasis protein [Salisediminibacterium halotolerans]GEL06639.1 copper homeostasis protein CutC [Salisediminibacterium halotolerans]